DGADNITEVLSHRPPALTEEPPPTGLGRQWHYSLRPLDPNRPRQGPVTTGRPEPPNSWRNGPHMTIVPPTHSGLPPADLERLSQGLIVSHQGQLPGFDAPTLSVAIPFQDNDRTTRVVYIHTLLQPITETLAGILGWIYGATGFTLLLSGLVAFLLSRRVARPLTRLHKAAENLRQGNFSERVPVQSNDELGRLGQTLNTLAAELAASLGQLAEKNRQLTQGMQSMRDLVANVSHELRTPLFLVQGYTEALRDGLAKTPAEQQEMAKIIIDEVERMQRLVQDLLQLAQLESGALQFVKETLTPTDLLSRVGAKLTPLAEQKGISLDWSVPENPPEIIGDAGRLEQCLINLIDNALRHTPAGGHIYLALEITGQKVRFSVADTGPGVPPEDITRVWERFYRGDKSRNRQNPGSGLGLAIVKAIIEAHGGQVTLNSRPGQGATFSFTIPFVETKSKGNATKDTSDKSPHSTTSKEMPPS
ncbi:MAG: ATP-binding protein, partial [Heliobacteriaceae bacterium]|nr:ATP-binding protein [Heliobacteriaceae bacterium]